MKPSAPSAPKDPYSDMLGGRLLRNLNDIPASGRAVAVLRHSARDDITTMRDAPFVPLNARGLEAAQAFGAALPKGRRLVLLHSPILRCQETAEQILLGYGGGTIQGPDEGLGIPYVLDLAALADLATRMGQREFATRWFSNDLEDLAKEAVEPSEDAAQALAALATDHLRAAKPGEIRLLVSHDWNVMLLRERLMSLRHQEVGWLDFLDGVVFTKNEGISLRWADELSSL
jgi:broad specificity phosphatase PhoE